ncbi:MAG: tryptophan-rich sensory protein [Clostridia bacterium]|nr:tryptophan-rich sensory protein [Clostridia bacterium]
MAYFQKTINLKKLLLTLGITVAAGVVSGFIGGASFDGLVKPPLTPPAWIFPVVWTILYVMMGYAAYRIATSRSSDRTDALKSYWLQLGVNALWTFFFFRLEWRLFAFFWLLLLLALLVRTIMKFQAIDVIAERFLYPYLAWCGFAAYLNLAFYLVNR